MKFLIKDLVSDILLEEKEEKAKKAKKLKSGIEASTGSGRFSAGVNEAGALAKDDPKQLMKNLGVKSAVGSDDIAKVKDLLKQAFVGTEPMKAVYTGLMQITKGDSQGLRVDFSAVKVRDAIKYLYHTLVGAQNAGILKLDSLVQVENNSKGIIIYVGEKRSW